jgi:mycothiol synthase
MSSSLPDRFTVRAARVDDAEAVAELSAAAELAVRGRADIDAGDVRDWWRIVDLERNTWVIEEGERIVAAATLWSRFTVPHAWGDVDPELTGLGLGTALLDLTEARALDLGATAIRHDVFGDDCPGARLLEARGYRPVRRYYTMRIDLGDEPPPEPEWPEGFRAEPFRIQDAEAFHDAQTEAFEDEWGFARMSFEEWRRARLEAEDFDPSVWTVVRDGDEIAALIRCDVFRYGGGWVAMLGVRKPWRRRGLGLALLLHTFRLFHARGERRIGLGVDTANPSGATRLYERAGMHVEADEISYERGLDGTP